MVPSSHMNMFRGDIVVINLYYELTIEFSYSKMTFHLKYLSSERKYVCPMSIHTMANCVCLRSMTYTPKEGSKFSTNSAKFFQAKMRWEVHLSRTTFHFIYLSLIMHVQD
jgi:hypothetical protein